MMRYVLNGFVFSFLACSVAFAQPPGVSPPPGGRMDPERMLERFDRNGDNKLTKRELPPAMADRLFDRADANNDDQIDLAELQRAFSNRRRMFGPESSDRQRGPGDVLAKSGLKVGDPLPKVFAYDDKGNEFQLRRLKGHYTVLVFGCLT